MILAIVGFVAFFVAVVGAIYSFIGLGGFSSFTPGMAPPAGFVALITSIAALTIIFIGLIIVFIAEILQIVAFFSIPEQMGPQSMRGQMGTPPPSPAM